MLAWELVIYSVYLLIMVVLVFKQSWENQPARLASIDFRLLFLGLVTYAADLLVRFTNAQVGAAPLAAVFALIVMNQVTARHRSRPVSEALAARASYAGVLSIGALLLAAQLVPDVLGIAYGAFRSARPAGLASVLRFTEPPVAALLLYDGKTPARSNGTVYTTYINEGAALLRRVSTPQETVLTMDMVDPFSYVLGRKPASGGMSTAAYNYTVSDLHHPSDEAYFGNANLVMVPKHQALDDRFFLGFYKIYEAGLQARYRLAAENDWWLLYRRR
jgi:hypothetical protein